MLMKLSGATTKNILKSTLWETGFLIIAPKIIVLEVTGGDKLF